MSNAVVACLSSYNSYTNYGCNEALTDTASQISNDLIAHDNSLCLYGNFSNDDYSMFDEHIVNTQSPCIINLVSGSKSIMPKQNLKDSSRGETHLNFMFGQEDISCQPWNSISLQQSSNNELQLIRDTRKASVETSDTKPKTSPTTFSLINSAAKEGAEDKKRSTRFQEKLLKIRKEKVPTVRRRSQKLTDKITALQKLVSPYGKTDTASVLLEASISIKALQDHIKDLFHEISEQSTTNMRGEKASDLQSRGLCLVPSLIFKELDKQLPIHFLLQ